jgi:hypothetical protein
MNSSMSYLLASADSLITINNYNDNIIVDFPIDTEKNALSFANYSFWPLMII